MSKSDQSQQDPRFSGIATFMGLPLCNDPSELDIAIVGVPYDGAAESRPGARHGPRELRNASMAMRPIHPTTRINPYQICRVGDGGDVPMRHIFDVSTSMDEITTFFETIHASGARPLAAGGDHSISLPILRAIAADAPVGLIHFDAHHDTCDEEMGCRYTHGTPFRRAVEEGLLDPKRVVQVGIRGPRVSESAPSFSQDSGMRVIQIEEFYDLGVENTIQAIRNVVSDDNVYLSFDIDVLDPAFAPGTGTPEIGGMTSLEAQLLLRGLNGVDIIGADLVEVSPPLDSSGITTLAGATLMFEILCLMAESNSV